MKLHGSFGSDEGQVLVDGNPIPVKGRRLGTEEITCTLPGGASEDVQVVVRNVPLTR